MVIGLRADILSLIGSVKIDEQAVFSVSMAFFPTKSASELVEGKSPWKKSTDTPGGYLSHG
jgi:hypothetical protein